tara:strand:+ start:72 stop:278 length:207 start_codon:yes stop_codon:yes gene_type:complete
MGKCSCGRSPTGLCIGWHALTKEEYEKKKKEHNESNDFYTQMMKEKEMLDMSMKESIRQKKERTKSHK